MRIVTRVPHVYRRDDGEDKRRLVTRWKDSFYHPDFNKVYALEIARNVVILL